MVTALSERGTTRFPITCTNKDVDHCSRHKFLGLGLPDPLPFLLPLLPPARGPYVTTSRDGAKTGDMQDGLGTAECSAERIFSQNLASGLLVCGQVSRQLSVSGTLDGLMTHARWVWPRHRTTSHYSMTAIYGRAQRRVAGGRSSTVGLATQRMFSKIKTGSGHISSLRASGVSQTESVSVCELASHLWLKAGAHAS